MGNVAPREKILFTFGRLVTLNQLAEEFASADQVEQDERVTSVSSSWCENRIDTTDAATTIYWEPRG